MVPLIGRAASPQALLSLRYMDGINSGLDSPRNVWRLRDKVMAGETPANPAACSPSGIWMGLIQD